jgi:hypothetical protein
MVERSRARYTTAADDVRAAILASRSAHLTKTSLDRLVSDPLTIAVLEQDGLHTAEDFLRLSPAARDELLGRVKVVPDRVKLRVLAARCA